MTEEEKELEERMKQYKYKQEENKKKLETLQKDMDKNEKKKSFIYRLSHTFGKIIYVWAAMGFIIFGLLLVWALFNYVNQLSKFNIIKNVEYRYDIDLKEVSRETEYKKIIYKVRPSKWKYRNIEFVIVQDGGNITLDDFQERYLKHIIDKMKDKQLLEGFQIIENYKEYNMLEYKLVYKITGENEINQKLENLKAYVKNKDKKGLIRDLNQLIVKDMDNISEQNLKIERLGLISQSFL